MHSTNDFPLQMQAHQHLSTSISLDCCQAIDLALTNADNLPGAIALKLYLTDASTPTHRTQDLGELVIPSSQSAHLSLTRAPVNDTLHFTIPSARLRQFNEITVVFIPAQERALGGPKVSLQHFTLIPR
jgi:hypothetical protein